MVDGRILISGRWGSSGTTGKANCLTHRAVPVSHSVAVEEVLPNTTRPSSVQAAAEQEKY